jgi:hypothetical protein
MVHNRDFQSAAMGESANRHLAGSSGFSRQALRETGVDEAN